jgi:amidohydrolase
MKVLAGALAAMALTAGTGGTAQAAGVSPLAAEVDAKATAIEAKMLAWRRDFHAHPELGNAEVRTSKIVADHLKKLGLEVRTNVAGTGVVAVLRGARPGPVVALRADMDALPVKEEVDLPFASKDMGTYEGKKVPVMHACGHDAHTAMLMAVAEVLASEKDKLPGTVVFIFQPAEEGPSDFVPDGKKFWGARQMLIEGAFDNPKPDAVFGMHVFSRVKSGTIAWRAGPEMASADRFMIKVTGRQTHGAIPWAGVDPIVVSSQIVLGLQTIESRQMEVTKEPSIVTVGQIHGGARYNIIPDSVDLDGTIRAFDRGMQKDIHARVARTADMIAQSSGAKAETKVIEMYGPTVNDPALTEMMAPTLKRVAGEGFWNANVDKTTGAEDFSFFQEKAPGLFFFLGVTPEADLKTAAANHSPRFYVDETALVKGVRAMAAVTVDYMEAKAGK